MTPPTTPEAPDILKRRQNEERANAARNALMRFRIVTLEIPRQTN